MLQHLTVVQELLQESFNIGNTDGDVLLKFDNDDSTLDGTYEVETIATAGTAQGSLSQTMTRFITETSALMAANGLTVSTSTGGDAQLKSILLTELMQVQPH